MFLLLKVDRRNIEVKSEPSFFFFIGDLVRVITSINKSAQISFWVKSKNKKAEKVRVPVSPEWLEIGSRYPDAVECRISSEILND